MISNLMSVSANAALTGDEFPWTLVIFIGILTISVAAIVLLLLTRRK